MLENPYADSFGRHISHPQIKDDEDMPLPRVSDDFFPYAIALPHMHIAFLDAMCDSWFLCIDCSFVHGHTNEPCCFLHPFYAKVPHALSFAP